MATTSDEMSDRAGSLPDLGTVLGGSPRRRDVPDRGAHLRIAAIGAHVSQVEGMLTTFGDDFFREGYKSEVFVLAAERSTQ